MKIQELERIKEKIKAEPLRNEKMDITRAKAESERRRKDEKDKSESKRRKKK